MDMGIRDRVAIVAAASTGLGKAVALGLAREGVKLAICARTQDTLEATAKEIRESSGGLPAVQALGFELTDPPRAQVSMNLLDTTQTSLATVWHEVERRANDAGVRILRGELIGLLPLDAALQVTADALKLESFERSRVIESHFLE